MFKFGSRKLGLGQPVFIVAELSGNHNGDIERAKRIIDAARDAGADAVKFQTYTPDTMTIDTDAPEFVVKTNAAWRGKTLYELYSEAYTPWEWHKELFAHAKKRGLVYFSTPFDETAVDFLETLKVPLYKVASFEIVDIPLLGRIGKTRKPVIMSRGMASIDDIKLAIKTLKKFGTPEIILLQCVSAYPARPEDMNLSMIPDLRKRFKVLSGLSDHSLSHDVAVASVALGACVIEKHLTLTRADGGSDAAFSLEPQEFIELVKSIRLVEQAMGTPSYKLLKGEKENIRFRKSLYVVRDIKKGEKFTKGNVRSIRPGYGLAPKFYSRVIGKCATRDIKRATPLSLGLLAK
ncbi:MAG: Pseudaminic acid synthase [Candidatus Kaiserbacteria bacterium GW2011_GWA1_50_28]|uniref:Pseudaminic acid synthase n=3 Tax=Candidatus Kaiseribacteriota TaxID=1752734 RepID=A0A0G1WH26_9BACT|nr:MAG: Pseudaminic acid synthase [Candidatus Kaiserbacteria bacterium GW2011_GWB1_50_17]KKW18564.1 MAG: Pseudaminic acid synthase [Candidatus Kaiserbacteria bacterium GW2011_GWA1_50_28]OGG87213.1 MAG: pseudaminic acid synthase [Candidatus Kaiserbacteria bacterium RIFCSPLOWO2_12_FULL_50_28]